MNKYSEIIVLLVATATAFSVFGCDDADSTSTTLGSCVETCSGNTLVLCDAEGNRIERECGDALCNLVDGRYRCGGNGICTEDDDKCDGNTLLTCKSGKLEQVDCAERGMICDDATKSCDVEKCTEDDVRCSDGSLFICEPGRAEREEDCRSKGKVCNAEAKRCETPKVIAKIGDPCTCDGESCYKSHTGADLKSLLKDMAVAAKLSGIDIGIIADEDTLIFPAFYTDSVKGCEGIIPPPGMTVECLRDSTMTITTTQNGTTHGYDKSGLASFIISLEGVILGGIGETIQPYTDKMHTLLNNGVRFSAQNGYCLATTRNISTNLSGIAAKAQTPIDKVFGLVNTGDHSIAKLDSTKCPEGSVKFVYEIHKRIDKSVAVGDVNIGFDMCLKSCTTDDDCRKDEGYRCFDIGARHAQEARKACFDGKNVEYLRNVAEQFASVAPSHS